MTSLKRAWANLILAPIWFFIAIVLASIYLVGQGIQEAQIPAKVTENTPVMLLVVQILLLITLLLTTRKDNFNLLKDGWATSKATLPIDIVGGIATGVALAVLYVYVFAPLQAYLQNTVGDYVPAGETMHALGKQIIPFFIANVVFAPFVEESLYRNYALTKFSEKYSFAKNLVLNVLFFGLLHWAGGFWYIVMTGLVVGLPFVLIATQRKNIIWVFVAHLTLNFLEFMYIATNVQSL